MSNKGRVGDLHCGYNSGLLYEVSVAENVCRHDIDAHVSKKVRVDVVTVFTTVER